MAASDADCRRTLLGAVLLGIGVMAAVDEIIFHQLLQWHHFFDRSTPTVGILADGLLHSAELIVLAAGFWIMAGQFRQQLVDPLTAWGAFLAGAGGFQLFDGIVDHKVLRIHQVRYVDPLWPYDLAWNGSALVLLAIGLVMLRNSRDRRPATPARRG